ncbi:MAG: hypothetical protein O3A87_04840 [Verrucomicrobia bacterium]|nr:hypothetical protein [Verrucomicrobiota bacterium]MDA1005794.1 hypothetical protein [Verrucomicrobiota bacterium]
MNQEREIEFVLRDRNNGVEITPSSIGFARFNEFNKQVAEFLTGSERLPLEEVHVRIEPGSYKLVTLLPILLYSSLESDLHTLARQDSLGEIDPNRAKVISTWQAHAKASDDLHYSIRSDEPKFQPIELSARTDYRIGQIVPWVKVEKYLFGEVTDMGGSKKANVHIRLDDSGKVVRIGSNQGYLHDQEQNRLYRKVLVRVEAEQHFKTGELRHFRLLTFEDYNPGYDEAALNRFIDVGSKAWAEIPDAATWVNELRGAS